MKKKYFSIGWLIVMSYAGSIFASDDTPEKLTDEKINIDMRLEIIAEKFQKNASKAFCNMNNYPNCFDISEKQCRQKIQPIVDKCIAYSNEKVSEIQELKARPPGFGKIFATCVLKRHIAAYPGQSSKISACIGKSKVDKKQLNKDLTQ